MSKSFAVKGRKEELKRDLGSKSSLQQAMENIVEDLEIRYHLKESQIEALIASVEEGEPSEFNRRLKRAGLGEPHQSESKQKKGYEEIAEEILYAAFVHSEMMFEREEIGPERFDKDLRKILVFLRELEQRPSWSEKVIELMEDLES